MLDTDLKELAVYRIEKAWNDLSDAKKTFELGMYDNSANRSYYAIFHAARAVLVLDGKDFKKHSGVISSFQRDYIKTEIFGKEMSKIISKAFNMRSDSDYEDFYIIVKEDVSNQLENAEYFVNKVDEYIKSRIQTK